MQTRVALREALRSIICASFTCALVLQLILGAVAGAAHAFASSSGPGGRGVICTANGSVPAPSAPGDIDHHQSGRDCCALGCAAPSISLIRPLLILAAILSPDHAVVADGMDLFEPPIREPPAKSTPQAPRAPPVLS